MEVEDIRLAVSPLTGKIYAGKINTAKTDWLNKTDVTNDFIHAVIERYNGKIEKVTRGDGRRFQIIVRELGTTER